MPEVAPTGLLNAGPAALADLLSQSTTLQGLLGVGDSAAALAKIWLYDVEESEAVDPITVVVDIEDMLIRDGKSTGAGITYTTEVVLIAIFEMDIPEDHDTRNALKLIANHAGAILSDIEAIAGTDDNLFAQRFTVMGPVLGAVQRKPRQMLVAISAKI